MHSNKTRLLKLLINSYQSPFADHAEVLNQRVLPDGLVDPESFRKQCFTQVAADGVDLPHENAVSGNYSSQQAFTRGFHSSWTSIKIQSNEENPEIPLRTSWRISLVACETSAPLLWLKTRFAFPRSRLFSRCATCFSGIRKLSPESGFKKYFHRSNSPTSKNVHSPPFRAAVVGTEFPTTLTWFHCAC